MSEDEFLFDALPVALAEIPSPDAPGRARVQIRIDDALVAHLGFDEDGDLTVELGEHERPLMELGLDRASLDALAGQPMTQAFWRSPGWLRVGSRLPAGLLLSRAGEERLAGLRGEAVVNLRSEADRATLRLRLFGHGPERRCHARLDVPTAAALAGGIADRHAVDVEGDAELFRELLDHFFPIR